MRRLTAVLVAALLAFAALTGCGDSGKPSADQAAGPGTDPTKNAATAREFFQAIASNDPASLETARALVAPESRALTYLELVIDGLPAEQGPPATLTDDLGRFRICAPVPAMSCTVYGAVVLTDGKVNDFTVDGHRIKVR